jgi:hypothetical protein
VGTLALFQLWLTTIPPGAAGGPCTLECEGTAFVLVFAMLAGGVGVGAVAGVAAATAVDVLTE